MTSQYLYMDTVQRKYVRVIGSLNIKSIILIVVSLVRCRWITFFLDVHGRTAFLNEPNETICSKYWAHVFKVKMAMYVHV